jgi:hypothetical protein
MRATRPSSKPSTKVRSHKGRARSSGTAIRSAQDLAEFRFRGGRSELAHTYVLRDIEVGIIEPCRWGLTERARAGSLPQFRHELQPAGNQTADVGNAEIALGIVQMPAIEDAHRRHVHRRRFGLRVQKGVKRGKGLRSGHNRLPPGTDVWANDTGRIFGLLAVRHRRAKVVRADSDVSPHLLGPSMEPRVGSLLGT